MEAVIEWLQRNVLTSTLILATIVAYITHRILYKNKNLPPGPLGLPIVGYLPFILKNAPEKFYKLRKKYGGVFGLYLGSQYTVVLTDYSALKEGLNNSAFLARPPNLPFDVLNQSKYTKTGFGGKQWLEQRRFILHVLRDLGFGKNRMEQFITEEITNFITELKILNGKPTLLRNILAPSTSNNIACLVYGKTYERNTPERKLIDDSLEDLSKFIGQTAIQIFIPWIKYIMLLTGLFNYKKAIAAATNLRKFVCKEIEEHKRTLDVNNIRDYIDGYLIELQKRKDDTISYFNDDMLIQTVQGLFGAGSGTIRESLMWAVLIMAKYQDVQKRVQHEIENVVGKNRLPNWSDHPKLPYTQAVINEMQRWRTITPLSILRYCQEDTMLKNFKIPKGSFVLSNIWSVHNDEDYWKDPGVFRPERFLDETETKVIRHDYYIPFSLGKMSCAGENMARVELFLYFTAIMQTFTIKPPDGQELDMKGTLGVAYMTKPQNLCFIEREKE